ncbi:ABC transporter substrate-binding protein [Pseudarthrobacter sp. P1]|uniref:ABC transporter substrate-binding protein n=1 Tax=Pseudarthrobacter sp. P1 TaxID=3418418 RepID=UPI003CE78BC2
MPQPVDVGSVLGGRYKVTAQVVVSAERDIVLDGVDQVLNRPVSILVAAPENSETLSQSAREVATGERPAGVSILDLGKSDGTTYLIANQTSAVELLDLVVPTAPYVEPFFTDTLGTEIFGSPRADAPGPNGAYDYVYEDDSPVEEPLAGLVRPAAAPQPPRAAPPRTAPSRPVASSPVTAPTQPPAPLAPAPAVAPAPVVPAPTQPPARLPKVTLWEDEDYGQPAAAAAPAPAAVPAPAVRPAAPAQPARQAASFPAAARPEPEYLDEDDDTDENAPRTSGRWLTGGIVGILVVAALIFAVTNISGLFGGTPAANPGKTATQSAISTGDTSTAPQTSAAPVVAPVIDKVIRYMPAAPDVGAQFDPRLPQAFDQNPATFWTTLEFSNDSFAGLADSINLIVELKEPSDISSITISQLGGSGGSFNVLTNSTPTMDGATKIGTGSFSAPDFTLKAPEQTKAQYVIINFTELPKIQPFVTYPYSIKIAEIAIK